MSSSGSDLPPKDAAHGWPVAVFERARPHMTEFVLRELVPLLDSRQCQRVVVLAPVKSGKREIVEYLAMRDHSRDSPRSHAFLSAWHRAADEDQRKELAHHNLRVFSVRTAKVAEECHAWIVAQVAAGKDVVLHLDECDHGSGDKQILGKVYKHVRDMERVFTFLYSATPQEVLFSTDVSQEEEEMLDDMAYGAHVEYTPPASYCGPGRFLEAGLVSEAKPFFTLSPAPALTEQGKEIMAMLRSALAAGSCRNIVTLRLSYKEGRSKKDKAIYQFLQHCDRIPELAGVHIWVDKGDCDLGRPRKIEWSDRAYWETTAADVPILIVMDQTSSRSTEWACHDRILATHDYRTTLQYTVVSQAQERINHYDSKYAGGFQPIKVYGHKKTFELSADRISYADYFQCDWTAKKVDVRRAIRDGLGTEDFYEIKSTGESGALHPSYPTPLTSKEADVALIELGCRGDVSLSSRVIGNVRPLPVFDSHFFACTASTWDTAITAAKATVEGGKFRECVFANPFHQAHRPPPVEGREHGYLRRWHILDYATDVKPQPGWGVGIFHPRLTICYSAGMLGVALRWNTGVKRDNNRLSAFRSMYPGRR